jgi:uncharacterized protein (TIRG00374 family)
MSCSKPRMTRKTIILPLIGLAAFFIYILLFNVDIPQIIATAASANPIIYFAAVLVSLAEVFFYALSWRTLLNNLQVKISVFKSYLFAWYGTFVDIVVPAESVSGELCRIYLVNREQSGTGGKVIASVVTQRILGMCMNVVFLLAGIYLLLIQTNINPLIFNIVLFFTVAITAIIALLLFVSAKENWSRKAILSLIALAKIITRGKWKRLAQIENDAFENVKVFHDSMKELIRKPQALIYPSLLSGIHWICGLSIPYLVFLSLGFQIPWSVILVTGAIVVAVKSIPIGIPFEVGLPEITMTTLYTSMLGLEFASICATATILSRIITLWLRFGIGFFSQQWVEIKSSTIQSKRSAVSNT